MPSTAALLLSLFFVPPDHQRFPTTTSDTIIMVNLNGNSCIRSFAKRGRTPGLLAPRASRVHDVAERPPDPQSLLSPAQLEECTERLYEWFGGSTKEASSSSSSPQILTITGAGLSTESGIPDYRGNRGSYHEGHKPMIHDAFVTSHQNRQRYWGRGMVGWRDFDLRQPNAGHEALVSLERTSKVGVSFEDSPAYHDPNTNEERYLFGNGQNGMTIVTQNVDNLHQRAGSQEVTELHGRTGRLKCMHCGAYASRNEFTSQMETLNADWLQDALSAKDENEMRPDGDAQLANHQSYNDIVIPPCPKCGDGFYKPDVVFFGDSVPKHRAARCKAAVEASTGGLLCIGTSLAVHSAYRLVKLAVAEGIPVCVLNVGETRPEVEGLPVTKIEAPIGSTLAALVKKFAQEDQ